MTETSGRRCMAIGRGDGNLSPRIADDNYVRDELGIEQNYINRNIIVHATEEKH